MSTAPVEERITRVEAELESLLTAFELHERRQEGEFSSIATSLTQIQTTLSTRLPTWATLLMTGMGTIIGVLVGVVSTHTIN
jgi:hypothetical protein